MSAPRVLFVSHTAVLGGAERMLLDLVGGWEGERRAVLLSSGPLRAALESRGVTVDVEPLGALGETRRESAAPGLGALVDVARLASRLAAPAREADVLHANTQKSFVVAAAAGLIARRPVVWHLHDILTTAHFSASNIRAAVMLANTRAAAVIANSEATAEAFRAAGGNARLVHVVYNGIPSAPFDAVDKEACHAFRAASGDAHAFVIAACGRLAPWKGQHVLIAALEAMPDAVAWIIGRALFGEDRYAETLRIQAAELGVADRVRFLGEREDVPMLLRAADLVVHTSVDPEPFGRVVVEGMLALRPVIAADAGGVPEIIRQGETGWLAPPGDPGALAERVSAVRALAAGERDAVVARAYADAVARFSPAAMVAGVRAVLDSVVSGRRRPG